jgi:hypothetical protein
VLLLVLVHFGGILTAVFSVAPGQSPACWLTNALWTVFYRPYLQFVYLNNAYHFYSPEPGPPTLLWFRLQYADGSYRWVKLPNPEDFPTRLEYQRRLAMTESTNQLFPTPGSPQFDNLLLARNLASNRLPVAIPLHPLWAASAQYRPSNMYSQKMTAAYARHVANAPEYRNENDPTQKVVNVQVFRVIHNMLTPKDVADGVSPVDESLYTPYYLGRFNPQGELVNAKGERLDREHPEVEDPFLYWMIPIFKVPKDPLADPTKPYSPKGWVVKDYLSVFAGDTTKPEKE